MGLSFENNGTGGGFELQNQTGRSKFRTFTDGKNPWPFEEAYFSKYTRGAYFYLGTAAKPVTSSYIPNGTGYTWQLCYTYQSFSIVPNSAQTSSWFQAYFTASYGLLNYKMRGAIAVGSAPDTSMSFNAPILLTNYEGASSVGNRAQTLYSASITTSVFVPANTFFIVGIEGKPTTRETGSDLNKISIVNNEPFIAVTTRAFQETGPGPFTASVPQQLGNNSISASQFTELSSSVLLYSFKAF